MYINFVSLLLLNMVAGLLSLAGWVYFDSHREAEGQKWSPPLAIAGFLALVFGMRMVFTWPLPGSFNILFGESSVFFGALLLGLACCLWYRLSPIALSVYGVIVGLISILLGFEVIDLGLTQHPGLAGFGFIWQGALVVLVFPALLGKLFNAPGIRNLFALGLLIAALVWAIIGFPAYWGHIERYEGWTPDTLIDHQQMP